MKRLSIFALVMIFLLVGCASEPAHDVGVLKQAEHAAGQATTWGIPQVGPVAPSVMAFRIQDSLDALLTAHRGVSRPGYAQTGTVWIKTIDATREEIYFFDGVADILIYWADVTNGRIYTAAGGLVFAQEDLSAVTSISITGLEPGVRYRLEAEIVGTGGGTLNKLNMRFGNASGIDTGNNYSWSGTRLGAAATTGVATDKISLTPGTYLTGSNYIYIIDFSIAPGDDTAAQVVGNCTGGPEYAINSIGGFYDGTAAIDRVQLVITTDGSLGTFDGRVRLLRTN